MKIGVDLFMHALRLVLNNLGQAVRMSAILYGVPVVASFFLLPEVDPAQPEIWSAIGTLLNLVLGFSSLWIAVSWHRFILLGEVVSGILPEFNGKEMWAYFLSALKIALLGMLLIGVPFILLSLLAVAAGPIIWWLAFAFGFFASLIFGYRAGAVFPAASVGVTLKVWDAWDATRGASGPIVVLAFLTLGVQAIFVVSSLVLGAISPPATLVWSGLSNWFLLILGITVLTTVYGHYVEGRPLIQSTEI